MIDVVYQWLLALTDNDIEAFCYMCMCVCVPYAIWDTVRIDS